MRKLPIVIGLLSFLQFTNYSWGWFPFTSLPSYEKTEERQKFAEQLLFEINKIYNSIPNLSPREEKWLAAELASENPQRKLKAISSEEQRKKDTKQLVMNIKKGLMLIYERKSVVSQRY